MHKAFLATLGSKFLFHGSYVGQFILSAAEGSHSSAKGISIEPGNYKVPVKKLGNH